MDNSSWSNSNWEETNALNNLEDKVKFCPECGERLPEAAAFCPYCGFKFSSIPIYNERESTTTENLHGQRNDSIYEQDSSYQPGGTSQELHEIEINPY